MAREIKRASIILILAAPLIVAAIVAVVWWATSKNVAIFESAGTIAAQERDLLIFGSLLSLLIVVPVFVLTFHISWKYRVGNRKARYQPEWDHNRNLETLWWGIPLALITILSVITWVSSYRLDPFRPLASGKKPLEVQVVALQWKWLFIYPEQNIASVNYVQFPEDRPVTFTITSDAPMNSFWIPELGGQIYAMSGMSTKLHLMADQPGQYRGSSANISGEGFAGMTFTAKASTQSDFNAWVGTVKNSPAALDRLAYQTLALPSKSESGTFYATVQPGLYDDIVNQYMSHSGSLRKPNQRSTEH